MKVGLTFDTRQDYNIEDDNEIYADFCAPREVAFIAGAIEKCGYDVELIGNMFKLNKLIASGNFDCDLVFVADEGINSRNREAIVPALLELNSIAYVGSDAYAMALSQNKFHTKLIAQYLGIKTPECIYIPYEICNNVTQTEKYVIDEMKKYSLTFPMVVKPNCEGYSMGVFKVFEMQELLEKVLWNVSNYHQEVLCEEYISGVEVNVPVLGTGLNSYVLGTSAWKNEDGSDIDIYSLKQKLSYDVFVEMVEFNGIIKDTLNDWSLKLHNHFNCRHFSRLDYKVTKDNKIYFLEFNPRPGLDKDGPFEICAKKAGKTYENIIGEIISDALSFKF